MQKYVLDIRETIKLAIPISIGQLGHIMMGVVDSVMVGQVGANPLAASSLVNGLYFLIVVLGIGMSSAITPLVAIANGEKNNRQCGVILNQGFIVNIIFSFLVLIALLILAEFIKYFDQPHEIAVLSKSYLIILAYSSIPFLVFQVFRQFCEGVNSVIPPMIIAIIANSANAFFNWILIFGKLGFEPMGLDGAGYSTLFTRSLMAIALIIFTFLAPQFKKYYLHIRLKELSLSVVKKLINIGLPSGFQYFLEVGSFAFAAIMVGWISARDLAAHQIAINLASVTYMIILGISAAGTIRVANKYGERNKPGVRSAGFTAFFLSGFVMAIFGLTFILTRKFLPTLYINDMDVIEIASNLIIIAALFQIFDGMQATGIAVLRGLTDVKIPMLLSFMSYWIISIPIAAILGFYFRIGTIGIWIGLSIGLAMVAIITLNRFNKLSKKIFLMNNK